MPESLGSVTNTAILKHESHKLHQEFTVATGSSVKKTDLVKLNAAGEIVPVAVGEKQVNVIGVALHNGAAEEDVTVMVKGHIITWGKANAATLNAGPVKVSAVADSNGVVEYANTVDGTDDGLVVGYSLDEASAIGESIRVMLI